MSMKLLIIVSVKLVVVSVRYLLMNVLIGVLNRWNSMFMIMKLMLCEIRLVLMNIVSGMVMKLVVIVSSLNGIGVVFLIMMILVLYLCRQYVVLGKFVERLSICSSCVLIVLQRKQLILQLSSLLIIEVSVVIVVKCIVFFGFVRYISFRRGCGGIGKKFVLMKVKVVSYYLVCGCVVLVIVYLQRWCSM